MREIPFFGALLAAMLSLTGCERPSTEAYVSALETMAELSERHDFDCDGMGKALGRFFDEEGAAIRVFQNQSHRLPKAERGALESPEYRPRVRAAMKRLIPGHTNCMKHPAVREAYTHLWPDG